MVYIRGQPALGASFGVERVAGPPQLQNASDAAQAAEESFANFTNARVMASLLPAMTKVISSTADTLKALDTGTIWKYILNSNITIFYSQTMPVALFLHLPLVPTSTFDHVIITALQVQVMCTLLR